MLKGKRKTCWLIFTNSSTGNSSCQVALLSVVLLALLPQRIFSTPMRASAWEQQQQQQQRERQHEQRCAHKSIAELIRTSPVILKALGARVFNDDDLRALVNVAPTLSATAGMRRQSGTASASAAVQSGMKSAKQTVAAVDNSNGDFSATTSAFAEVASILITLTPETIYKGASLLKMTTGSGDGGGGGNGDGTIEGGMGLFGSFRRGSGGNTSNGNGGAYGGSSTFASGYQYEGQLNATLQPLACFDTNIVNMLPTELIAFGKLVPLQQPQERQPLQSQSHLQDVPEQIQIENLNGQARDVLHISINGLHRWTPQFENHIWKHLGWDHWSDFTLCSVTCGKGVQQRFRRCLLDNPLVNINMNMNFIGINDEDDDDDVEEDANDIADDAVNNDDDNVNASKATDGHEYNVDNEVSHFKIDAKDDDDDQRKANANNNEPTVTTPVSQSQQQKTATMVMTTMPTMTLMKEQTVAMLHKHTQTPTYVQTTETYVAESNAYLDVEQQPVTDAWPASKTSVSNEHESVAFVQHISTDGYVMSRHDYQPEVNNHVTTVSAKKHAVQHKKRKSAKTLFCEGYNIEQRNCNTFECSDDINDLLKFYKKLPTPDDPLPATFQSSTTAPQAAAPANRNNSIENIEYSLPDFSAPTTLTITKENALTVANSVQPSSTPANMGYIHSWRNSLNFTLMLTLRIKNDTRNTTTIFSIRNETHNLYLDGGQEGLRLYLERDNTTEMLPIKFNLYDYRWHQVAISIQNGDFISIYVDCSWTNSFVVSKRLYTLPLAADVEIGRGFNGELQQLLVLPGQQERQQCSKRRTAINEVKRYIIDTFIDDYGN